MARDIRKGDLVDHRYANGRIFRRNRGDNATVCKILGCHLVARKERLAEVWPTDDAFRRFAAEVADAVQAALARGVKIGGRGFSCDCPLGCLPQAYISFPKPESFLPGAVGTEEERRQFIEGFDGGEGYTASPYYRLGQAYRRRFVEGEKL